MGIREQQPPASSRSPRPWEEKAEPLVPSPPPSSPCQASSGNSEMSLLGPCSLCVSSRSLLRWFGLKEQPWEPVAKAPGPWWSLAAPSGHHSYSTQRPRSDLWACGFSVSMLEPKRACPPCQGPSSMLTVPSPVVAFSLLADAGPLGEFLVLHPCSVLHPPLNCPCLSGSLPASLTPEYLGTPVLACTHS